MSNTPSKAESKELAQQHLKAFVPFSLGEVWFEGEVEFARAVLAKWGTPQQEAQEPVAWLNPWRADQVTTDYDAYGERGIPLYTAPQPAPASLSECLRLLNSFEYEGDEDSQAKAFFKAHINEDWFFHVKNSLELAIAAQGGKV